MENNHEPTLLDQDTINFRTIVKTSAITALITTILVSIAFLNLAKTHPGLTGSQTAVSNRAVMQSQGAVVDAVKTANPAVVAITISKNVPVYERSYESVPGPFGNFFQVPQIKQNGTRLQDIGGGSGFIVSSDGYIVTNKHVVADAEAEYTVFTNDGKKYNAKVIGRDPILDLAVIKIDGNNFPSLAFGDSDQVQVGQTAIAIGNALGEFRNTVSVGVISGLSRSITASDRQGGTESLDQLIQTDAGINPGNSGGPLLNLAGEVIGVNVAVASDANSIGFALSSNSVKNVVESVKKNGRIVRPYIGVRFVPVTDELKEQNNLPVNYGAWVNGNAEAGPAVQPGSPAEKAGIKANDIILEIDGVKIDDKNQLPNIIGKKKVGDRVTIKILRDGKETTATVTLEEMR